MRIIITGGGGFVGRALASALEGQHDLVLVDHQLGTRTGVEGDLCHPATLDRAFADGCDAVVHLATVPGGAAEQDPATAKSVNMDATMALAEAAAQSGQRPRFIFASSIAVFGDPLPAFVDDDTPLAPRMIYGAHKALMEQWLAAQTRRGAISALSLRLPGIIARPRGPSGMKSAFMSDVFHALKAGERIALPVSPQATMWLMSVAQIAQNLVHALQIDTEGAFTLPAQRVVMEDLVKAICGATGSGADLVAYAPDTAIEHAFGSQPPLSTPAAEALGFAADADLEALVHSALSTLS